MQISFNSLIVTISDLFLTAAGGINSNYWIFKLIFSNRFFFIGLCFRCDSPSVLFMELELVDIMDWRL
jgi:hypothetical protein